MLIRLLMGQKFIVLYSPTGDGSDIAGYYKHLRNLTAKMSGRLLKCWGRKRGKAKRSRKRSISGNQVAVADAGTPEKQKTAGQAHRGGRHREGRQKGQITFFGLWRN